MADQQHLRRLSEGVASWNAWREANPTVRPDLTEATLRERNLVGFNLSYANFSRADLERADLSRAALVGTDFTDAAMPSSKLRGANLRGAIFTRTNLCDADLTMTGPNWRLIEPGAPASDRLLTSFDPPATASGLTPLQFAGADLALATLPSDISSFEPALSAKHIADRGRVISLALIAAVSFSLITLLSSKDVDLLLPRAHATLPFLNITVPISWFQLIVPLVLLSVYVYFHLHLQQFWNCLSAMPMRFPDGRLLDVVAQDWLLTVIVREFVQPWKTVPANLAAGSPLSPVVLHKFQLLMTMATGWGLIPFTIFVFWVRILPLRDLTLIIFSSSIFISSIFLMVFFYECAKQSFIQDKRCSKYPWTRSIYVTFYAFMIVFLFNYGIYFDRSGWPDSWLPIRNYALLVDEQFATPISHPDGTLRMSAATLTGRVLPNVKAMGAFFDGAILVGSVMVNADLTGASLRGANLTSVDLTDANLTGADLRDTTLLRTTLRNAILTRAKFNGNSNLDRADLQGAILIGTRFEGVDLSKNDSIKESRFLEIACVDENTKLPAGVAAGILCPDQQQTTDPSALRQ